MAGVERGRTSRAPVGAESAVLSFACLAGAELVGLKGFPTRASAISISARGASLAE